MDSPDRSRWGQLWHSDDCMRGLDVHVTGYDLGPATDQWSCDCGQHARKSKACISVRESSRPKKRSGDVYAITISVASGEVVTEHIVLQPIA